VQKAIFGQTTAGEPVEIFTLTNRRSLEARVMTWGAALVSMRVPDRHGVLADVTLGFDTLDGYLARHPYFGVTTGRFANRIAGGRFTLDGTTYPLATNDGAHHLHGGVRGIDKWNWRAEPSSQGGSVRFTHTSPDGDEGYPGTLQLAVTYTLNDDDELRLDYEATTDRATVLNLTNHAYWNLAGAGAGDILGHEVTIHAYRFTAVNAASIPTGEIASVAGGPLDFTQPKIIAQDFAQMHGEPGGYDHNFVLDPATPGAMTLAAEVRDPQSGRVLRIATTEPGIQFYTGNYLDGSVIGKGGVAYRKNAGFCLETQHFPDSPNQPHFPTTVLRPGETFRSATVHRFSCR
jgi:aldose 1-epimerase